MDVGSIDPDWKPRAACRNGGELGDPDAWFIVSGKKHLVDAPNIKALNICQTHCPVREECDQELAALQTRYLIAGEIRAGVWFDTGGKKHLHAEG
jgi:hypothetical protein